MIFWRSSLFSTPILVLQKPAKCQGACSATATFSVNHWNVFRLLMRWKQNPLPPPSPLPVKGAFMEHDVRKWGKSSLWFSLFCACNVWLFVVLQTRPPCLYVEVHTLKQSLCTAAHWGRREYFRTKQVTVYISVLSSHSGSSQLTALTHPGTANVIIYDNRTCDPVTNAKT